jgi:hypothetical protein
MDGSLVQKMRFVAPRDSHFTGSHDPIVVRVEWHARPRRRVWKWTDDEALARNINHFKGDRGELVDVHLPLNLANETLNEAKVGAGH